MRNLAQTKRTDQKELRVCDAKLWPEPMRMYVCDQVCDLTVPGNEVLDGDNSDQEMVLDNMI